MATADEDGPDPAGEDGVPAIIVPAGGRRVRWVPEGAEGAYGQGPLLGDPEGPTPLADDLPDRGIPPPALWAMKGLRTSWSAGASDGDALRWHSGGDERLDVIDDGPHHCMISRLVGWTPDGTVFCLVSRISRVDFELARQGQEDVGDLLSLGRRFSLCGVTDGPVGNVVLAASYRRYRDIPLEYLPPSPPVEFEEPP